MSRSVYPPTPPSGPSAQVPPGSPSGGPEKPERRRRFPQRHPRPGVPPLVPPPATTVGPFTPSAPPGSTVVQAQNGATAGLYGGTRDIGRCDRNQMISYLIQNPAKANAWVAALSSDPGLRWSGGTTVGPEQIPQYINELTPVILRSDTRVTNHGFLGGRPTPRQSVLEAGTAVLVDRYGVPRARCACGNPLLPPRPVPSGPVYTGPPWPGWAPGNITVIQQSTTIINTFVLVNVSTGEKFGRPPRRPRS